MLLLLLCLTFPFLISEASHFRGGIITWRALNTTPSGPTATVLIRQRYSWRRSNWPMMCTSTMIAAQTLIAPGTGTLTCVVGSCGGFVSITTDTPCTDFSAGMDYSSGERYDTRILSVGASYTLSYLSNAWMSLAMGGNGNWVVTGRITLTVRPDGILNTSPITNTLPIIYKQINVQHVQVIQMTDYDGTDTLRCRWSTSTGNTNNYDECGSVCAPSIPPGYQLFGNNCTLVFTLTVPNYYAVALQIEDYYTSSSSTPMSSVPIQFLFYARTGVTGCSTAPSIIGVRPNRACIGTPLGIFVNETVITQVGCVGKSIIEFTTSSPVGMSKTSIINISPGIYMINLLWTPAANQFGPQGFCAAAVDNTNVQSVPWCITFLVGFIAPNLQVPLLVQGTASPVGTVFANHTIFSIQIINGMSVNRPGRNGTYINFHDATVNGTIVISYDCGWSPNVIYTGNTIVIYAPYPWFYGHQYYLTFDSGVASGNEFCLAESAPVRDPYFWVFDIWDPGLSSTTMTTISTSIPTVPTITTRPPRSTTTTTPAFFTATLRGDRTTTVNPNLTTIGIPTPSTATQSTVVASSPSATTTNMTTAIAQSTTTTISSQEYIKACEVPVAVATLLSMIAMVPIKMIAMFTLFTKIHQMRQNIEISVDQAVRKY